ncbi:MAG: hypothetical protein Q8M22_08960 [Actinomycetota bacterium]|nr:hypothetical protein [Actinomycetota bacterium]
MSNILRDAAESTMHVAESTLQSVADFVEDAYRNIELPHIELPSRRRSSPVRSILVAVLGVVALVGVAAMLLRRFEGAASKGRHDADTADATKPDATKDDAAKTDPAERNGRSAEREARTAS